METKYIQIREVQEEIRTTFERIKMCGEKLLKEDAVYDLVTSTYQLKSLQTDKMGKLPLLSWKTNYSRSELISKTTIVKTQVQVSDKSNFDKSDPCEVFFSEAQTVHIGSSKHVMVVFAGNIISVNFDHNSIEIHNHLLATPMSHNLKNISLGRPTCMCVLPGNDTSPPSAKYKVDQSMLAIVDEEQNIHLLYITQHENEQEKLSLKKLDKPIKKLSYRPTAIAGKNRRELFILDAPNHLINIYKLSESGDLEKTRLLGVILGVILTVYIPF